mmetsp:Transcript_36555/g.81376  ORF Transcript_36555/g.81376 Transcript_36555/m.81376 type:complete len:1235 (-) Transcript_36555:10-3714(-)
MPSKGDDASNSSHSSPSVTYAAHHEQPDAHGQEPAKPGSRLQQLSNRFKLRRNKPPGTSSPGSTFMPTTLSSTASALFGVRPRTASTMDGARSSQEVLSSSGVPAADSGITRHTSGLGAPAQGPGRVEAGVQEFSPPSHPNNPFAPLLTPFKMMVPSRAVPQVAASTLNKPASVTRTFLRRYVPLRANALPKFDGTPPMGYLWLWMGAFRRWQRRFFVASEAPGLVLIYKRMNMKGKVWSISLRAAAVAADDGDPRQLKIITGTGQIFLRAANQDERSKWVECLRQSIQLYNEKQMVVEELKEQGLLPSQADDGSGSMLPSLNTTSIKLPVEVAEMDVEQRRRIRARVADRLAELVPYQQEVERHVGLLNSQLLGVVSGLNVRLPAMTPSNSVIKLATPSFRAQSMSSGAHLGLSPLGHPNVHAAAAAAVAAVPGPVSSTPAPPPAGPVVTAGTGAQAAAPASPSAAAAAAAAPAAGGAAPLPPLPHKGTPQPALELEGGGAPAPDLAAQGSSRSLKYRSNLEGELSETALGTDRVVPGMMSRMRGRSSHSTNLQQAYANLLESFRSVVYTDAVRMAQLEMENNALQRSLALMKSKVHAAEAALKRTRSEAPGAPLAGLATRTAAGTCMASPVPDSDSVSVMTADEDAFDITEPFDDDIDYDILDVPGDGDAALPWPRNSGQDKGAAPDAAAAHGVAPVCRLDDDDEGDDELGDEDEDDEDEDGLQEAEVLDALEVVRQVEYVEKVHATERFADIIATRERPTADPEMEQGDDDDDDDDEADLEGFSEGEVEGAGRRSSEGKPGKRALGKGPSTRAVVHRVRSRLPAPRPLGRGFSVWSILKNMIGKDLTRITMPATINEPLDFLQRLAETFEYYTLLDKAAEATDSTERMMMVCVWQLSCYNSQALREGKPFNPLLGETYEWQPPDGSVRFLCEQVSHHPPVSAYVAEGLKGGWEVVGEYEVKTKFWGKSIEMLFGGCEGMRFKAYPDEQYKWNRGTVCVHDVILGNYWSEVYGKWKIVNLKTGDTAMVNIKPCRGRRADRGKFEGSVFDGKGREVYRLSGSTMDKVYAALTPEAAAARGGSTEPMLMWEKLPPVEDMDMQYNFTKFAITLNDPADPIVPAVPPTDARFRTDQRALELGEFAKATTEKLRLEEKQRQARRKLKEAGREYRPLWFKHESDGKPGYSTAGHCKAFPLTKQVDDPGFVWQFTGEYWKHRERRDWGRCADLYSTDPV